MAPETVTCPRCNRTALLDPETDAMVHLDTTGAPTEGVCTESAAEEALLQHLESREPRRYRVVPSVFARPSVAALAPARAELTDALADMGTGVVIDSTDTVVAFHESHLRFVTAGVGNYRA